ncbi:MAG: hypothetical protein JKY82_09815 [Rhizobiaceae bacterium]|nr:hypothetical protein [Rhizobiaceae bacterium]
MNIKQITLSTLVDLHAGCVKAYANDRSMTNLEKVVAQQCGDYYGADGYPDWKLWVDMLESELTDRGVEFNSIDTSI